jgi:hypothetical protein
MRWSGGVALLELPINTRSMSFRGRDGLRAVPFFAEKICTLIPNNLLKSAKSVESAVLVSESGLNASPLETRGWRILEKQNERIINVRIQKKLDSSAIISAF